MPLMMRDRETSPGGLPSGGFTAVAAEATVKEVKVFLDHFYFSLIAVLIGMIVLYLLWATVSGAMGMAGSEASGTGFTMGGNIWLLALLWVLISGVAAGVLTALTIRNRPKDQIVYTKRQY